MPYIDEFGTEWEREHEHVGAWLKLSCPVGTIVSRLIRTGGGGPIRYRVEGSIGPDIHWPPDPTSTHYGERCPCDVCVGRLVGATVEELRAEVDAIHSASVTSTPSTGNSDNPTTTASNAFHRDPATNTRRLHPHWAKRTPNSTIKKHKNPTCSGSSTAS